MINYFSNSKSDNYQVNKPTFKKSKFEDVEDAKFTEIKPDDEKKD